MTKRQLGIENGRWHPNKYYNDWNAYIKTEEGIEYVKKLTKNEKKLVKARSSRIDYEQELKRTDLTELQRLHYRKQLNKEK